MKQAKLTVTIALLVSSYSVLAEHAFDFDMEYTGIYQGLASGTPTKTADFFHRLDMKASVDFEKLSMWENGKLSAQLQAHNGGHNTFGINGSPYFSPNSAAFLSEDLFLSSLYYSHQFSQGAFLLGKIDAFELLKDGEFYGGAGRYGFMNLAFSAPPSGVVPPAFIGLVANWQTTPVNWTAMIYDPRNRYTSDHFSEIFQDGINLSLTASKDLKILDRNSNVSLTATYSTEEGKDLDNLVDPTAYASGKYNLRAQVSHNIYEDAANPANAWGVYIRAAVADGNPNLLSGTFSGGIGGSALIPHRVNDQWGVGYFLHNISNSAQDSINGQIGEFEIRNEQGVEAFYSYAVTPSIHITGDMQYLQAMDSSEKHALIFGLRTNIKF
ncbi:carbohydrate porin [Vibrio tubiashii]|uniref:Uncharacterized protein n=1 Tax=Vibrio tubiashii ATCC 19109 TaxID=1051646 RepID=F9T9M7_9VIBR|nr:carbohydrate porin [Vibrio tubiashii]AIW15620.1 hypothetical protein IX91_16100 [Vibrio tubiashii ATCC 19109]EGU51200.1 hypothetical protein VITU9109_10962 [Vibrio tubiashii ATCC 19109]EIF02593.1 hypothetical protein VT1337_17690 [Vibrio tubiashii NCIMB 1337 = ATCC 19106]